MKKLKSSNVKTRPINPNGKIKIYDLEVDGKFGKGMSFLVGDREVIRYNLIGDAYEQWDILNQPLMLFPFGITYREKARLAFSNLLLHHQTILELCGVVSPIDSTELKDSLYWIEDTLLETNTKVIIVVGGKQERWGNYLGISKHNVEVNGETLVKRMVRLFKSFGIKDITLVGQDPEPYQIEGTKFYKGKVFKPSGDANKYLDSQDIWNKNGRTLIVHGDVYFTDKAIYKLVFDQNRDWMVIARPTEGILGKKYGEAMGLSFYPHEAYKIKESGARSIDLFNRQIANGASTAHLYRCLIGLPDELINNPLWGDHVLAINDLTDDFDIKEDFHRFFSKKDTYT